ncbi:superoxide dismutase [Paenibacillus sp. JCM 10914]|nr:superoxide dismutase [Paenibacillus sp. JCM 10914]
MSQSKSRITAFGTYVPERILTNADLEKLVETSDEWIVQRTGMKERRIAAPDQYVSDLAIQAWRIWCVGTALPFRMSI